MSQESSTTESLAQIYHDDFKIGVALNRYQVAGEILDAFNPYTESLPDSVQQKLTDRYVSLFNLFKKHNDKINRVTFWGLNDGQSWLNNFPIRGRTNYPLLFDRE